jgi:Methyltransferase domain
LRWLGKLKNVRRHGRGRMTWLGVARYVLWSPELGDYSFEMADRDALVRFAAAALDCDPEVARRHLDELEGDQRLGADIAERRRRGLLDRRPGLGQRRLWWVLARVLKPELIVETGVWYGLGSAVLLRALELNELEGAPGQLLGFDPDPSAGWLVHPRHRERWRLVQDPTEVSLAGELAEREVGLFISDTPSSHDREAHEFSVAFARAARPAVLLAANGEFTPALADLAREHDLPYHHMAFEIAGHFYSAQGVSLARVR